MKTQRKHGFTIVELVVVIAVIAILAAVLIPTFVSIIKKANDSAYLQERTSQQIADLAEKVENQNYLTWEDFEAKLAIAMANSANDTSAKIREAVQNALSGISGAGLSEEQVKKIVEKALDGQLTVTQVEAIVSKAISGIPSSATMTEAQIRTIVNSVIGSISQTGVTKAQVDAAIKSAISGLASDIQNEITNAVNDALEKFKSDALTSEDVQKIIEAVINGHSSNITLTLNKDNLSLNVGASETLVATVTPEGTEIGWVSSDTSVATVSNGTVTAVAAGNATITVTAGGATVTCAVTVTEAQVINANPKIKIVEGENGALYLQIDKSDMGEYADQVAYYEIIYTTKLNFSWEEENINDSRDFSISFSSKNNEPIPYIGFTEFDNLNETPNHIDDIEYEIEELNIDFISMKTAVNISEASYIEKVLKENNVIGQTDTISGVFTYFAPEGYSGYGNWYFKNLTPEEESNVQSVALGKNTDSWDAAMAELGVKDRLLYNDWNGPVCGIDDEGYGVYTIRAYKEDGTSLGETTYGNAYSQWKNKEGIVVIPEEYQTHSYNNEDTITYTLRGYSNTFGYYNYVLESTGFVTKKIGE